MVTNDLAVAPQTAMAPQAPRIAVSTTAPASWQIQHIDLSQPWPDLTVRSDGQGYWLVLWWHQIPLGHLEIPPEQLPLTAGQWLHQAITVITPTVGGHLLEEGFQAPLPGAFGNWQSQATAPKLTALAALQQPLDQLQRYWQDRANAQGAMTVSVIICTRDRPDHLARCLRSLQGLATPPAEILVVDNAPTSDATQRLVAQFPAVRYCQEPQPGLSVARNTGLRQATGHLVAFTDDDVEVHSHWIEQLRVAFQDPQVMAMTGLVLPARLDTEAEQVFQRGATGFGWGYRPLRFDHRFFAEMKPLGVPVWRIGAGANMAFRRQVFADLGGFDERLGAGAAGCSEDSELWYRILATGGICHYQPTAVVFHHHRADLGSLKQQMQAYMAGHVVALLVQAERHGHWGNLRRLVIALPRYYLKRLILGALHRFQGPYRTVGTEVVGCLAGVTYYWRDRGKPPTAKPPLGRFLAQNPFPSPLTLGFFYREKMRAIYRVAPERAVQTILEIGGGQGGLTALLYPQAQITNLDCDPAFAQAPCNQAANVQFVCGDATQLPFAAESFDMVTMFDVLEHIPDDQGAIAEAWRVLKPGGTLLISTPNQSTWRFPHYRWMTRISPPEADLMAEWGHVRRGYTLAGLQQLLPILPQDYATFINPITVIGHDIAFSRLPKLIRHGLIGLLSPLLWTAYWFHHPHQSGTEIASCWQKPNSPSNG